MRSAVGKLVNHAHVEKISFKFCENIGSSDGNDTYTVYSLRDVALETVTTSLYPLQFLALDEYDFNNTHMDYRDHHIAFVSQNMFDGHAELRGTSVFAGVNDDGFPAPVQTALDRAPMQVRSKADGMFMITFYLL